MDTPIYLGCSVLQLSKFLMYEFWYNYLKPKYKDKINLCYNDTDSFVLEIETEGFYEDIKDGVDKWFDTSEYSKERPLPIKKNKKVVGKFKDELPNTIMIEFVAIQPKMYSFLTIDHKNEQKKAQGTNKCIFKKEITHNDYFNCLMNKKIIRKTQYRLRCYNHRIYTEKVNKVALNYNDDKRLQTYDNIHTYPYGINPFLLCKNELLCKIKNLSNSPISLCLSLSLSLSLYLSLSTLKKYIS